eukprot:Tbor_TRINITY_DN5306_c0_g1::TRINITY_DN5306_c0_g1_i1::g.4349::m.4349
MAALSPIEVDANPINEPNYYHLTIVNIPLQQSIPDVAEKLKPNDDSPEAKELLDDLGYQIVPHQLHVFKENLPKKFAMFTYYLKPVRLAKGEQETNTREDDRRRTRAHDLFIKYMENSHPKEHSDGSRTILAQPKSVRNCIKFFEELTSGIPLLSKNAIDVKKLRTWLLSKVTFKEETKPTSTMSSSNALAEESPVIGTLNSSNITTYECMWLKTQHKSFPQAAGHNTHLIIPFFVRNLHPMFVFEESIDARLGEFK